MHTSFKLRLLSLLLCCALLAGLTTAVFAQSSPATPRYPDTENLLMVEGVTVTEESLESYFSDGRIEYDFDNKILTINESINGGPALALYSSVQGLTIRVEQNVTLYNEDGHVVNLEGDTTITGPGKLTINGQGEADAAILVSGDATLTLENCNLEAKKALGLATAKATDHPQEGGGGLIIRNSTVNAEGSNGAITGFDGGIWLADCEITQPVGAVIDQDAAGLYSVYDSSHNLATSVRIEPLPTVLHTVYFDMNGHGRSFQTQVADGEAVAMPANPSEEGWFFEGWYTDAACTQPYDFSTPVTADLTLYAKWEEEVSFIPNQLFVEGVSVTKESLAGYFSDGRIGYDFDSKTLTLRGNLNGISALALYSSVEGLTVYVETDVVLRAEEFSAVLFEANTTITGPGTLTVFAPQESDAAAAILVGHDAALTLAECKLELCGCYGLTTSLTGEYPEDGGGSLIIRKSTVHADGTVAGISGFDGGITLSGCEIKTPAGGFIGSDTTGLYAVCNSDKAPANEVLIAPATGTTSFNDVPENQYYADPVAWAVENEITNGTGNGKFSPDATCTRGQVVTFLWRACGCPEPTSTENPFTDVKTDDYFFKAVLWAKENGITSGTSADKFSPGQGCTRAQVVTFLWRAAGKPAALVRGDENELPIIPIGPGDDPSGCMFTDVEADQYYYDAVLWAVAQGITQGTSATTFSPGKTCTRGQIVTFLYRDLAEE